MLRVSNIIFQVDILDSEADLRTDKICLFRKTYLKYKDVKCVPKILPFFISELDSVCLPSLCKLHNETKQMNDFVAVDF